MITIDLTKGITETDQYKAFKFPGGEIHVDLKQMPYEPAEHGRYDFDTPQNVELLCSFKSSDDIMLLAQVAEILDSSTMYKVSAKILYMGYQQADRRFAKRGGFGLKVITNLLNSLPIVKYTVFDPHSDVTPALLRNCTIIDNSDFIEMAIDSIVKRSDSPEEDLVLLAPDAGAYKKIFKLADKIKFKGQVEAANKSRNGISGKIDSILLSCNDFQGKDVLIVDDICVGGRTFVELAKLLQDKNVGNLYLAVSHGIFSNGFEDIQEYFYHVFSTNSRLDWKRNDYVSIYQIC